MYIFYLLTLLTSVLTQCTNPRLRKEIRDLSSYELYALTDAMRTLHNTPSPIDNRYSIHEYFTKIHFDDHETSHGFPRFLPWHRYFIRLYEIELQKIDSSIMLPYWDWSLDAQHPEESQVLSYMYFGSNGDPNQDYCVVDGEFAYMEVNYQDRHCLARNYDLGDKISVFGPPEAINPYLNSKSFSDFEYNIEGFHADPHNNIGNGKDFGTMISPNDPLFYLHHSFMDLLWYNWQQRNPSSLQYEGVAYDAKVGLNDPLYTWKNKTVQNTLSTTKDIFCYTYPGYPTILQNTINRRAIQATNTTETLVTQLIDNNVLLSQDNSRLTMGQLIKKFNNQNSLKGKPKELQPYLLKKRKPMSPEWAKMNGLDLNKVRKNERIQNQYIDILNQLPEFISLAFKKKPRKELKKRN